MAEAPGVLGPLILACGGAAGLAGLVLVTGGGLLPAFAAYSLGGAGLMLAPVLVPMLAPIVAPGAKAALAAARPRLPRRRMAVPAAG